MDQSQKASSQSQSQDQSLGHSSQSGPRSELTNSSQSGPLCLLYKLINIHPAHRGHQATITATTLLDIAWEDRRFSHIQGASSLTKKINWSYISYQKKKATSFFVFQCLFCILGIIRFPYTLQQVPPLFSLVLVPILYQARSDGSPLKSGGLRVLRVPFGFMLLQNIISPYAII